MSMGDPVNQAQFFERMQLFDDKLQDMHRRQREQLDKRFGEVLDLISRHDEKHNAIVNRVTIIETERSGERRKAERAGAIFGVIAGATVNALIIAFKKMLGWS